MDFTKSVILSLIMGIIVSSCATAYNGLPETFFDCQHKYDDKRSFIVESPVHDIKHIQANNCSDIIKQNACPIIIKIESLQQNTIYLTENEMNNYNCIYKENKNENK